MAGTVERLDQVIVTSPIADMTSVGCVIVIFLSSDPALIIASLEGVNSVRR